MLLWSKASGFGIRRPTPERAAYLKPFALSVQARAGLQADIEVVDVRSTTNPDVQTVFVEIDIMPLDIDGRSSHQ